MSRKINFTDLQAYKHKESMFITELQSPIRLLRGDYKEVDITLQFPFYYVV